MIFKILQESIENFIEDCKEKEYVVYYNSNMSSGRYDKHLFTKKQLLKFIKENELYKIEVFKIKDEIKINKTIEIEEVQQCKNTKEH